MKTITIVGGGLAGLSLGIALRRQAVPVKVWEAGHYPRHRVCGEFISGRGVDLLEQLGLRTKVLSHGGMTACTALFCTKKQQGAPQRLPQAALSVSRYVLDALLADEFRAMGGELLDGQRWQGDFHREGVVHACGRAIHKETGGWRWVGLKVHAAGVELAADLEMHLTRNGYVGLCRLADGEVNVCGLFRSRAPSPDLARNRTQWLRGEAGSLLSERLQGAMLLDDSFRTVAGLCPWAAARQSPRDELAIGDAWGMIPPLTGNGMSMAFESASLAAAPVAAYSRGLQSWPETVAVTGREMRRRFHRRLTVARWLQCGALSRAWGAVLTAVIPPSRLLWPLFFHATR